MRDSGGIHREWLEKGFHDIEVAQFLYDHDHYTDAIALHIHQALQKTHDLITLASRAEDFGLDLRDREDALDRINEYYVESRYPLGAPTEYSRQEIAGSLGTATEIIDLIGRMS